MGFAKFVTIAPLYGILVLLTFAAVKSLEEDVVNTVYGPVRGYRMKSRDGLEYRAFTKIPYAKPPIGQYRFSNPVAPDPWTKVYNATGQLPKCMQIPVYDPHRREGIFGTADCLYLSVFTPSINGKRDVMAYMHGGGWRSSAPGNGPNTRSRYLMDYDVVLVMLNYRLGGLGFLSTEDEVLPGNYGLKDQAAALKWIHENIQAFGGDPDSITVFGESAGGGSSHLLQISPLSKDLIKGSISQSGVATALWTLSPPGTIKDKTIRLASSLGCPTGSSQEILDCLRQKSAFDITNAERMFTLLDYVPPIVYPPVIEPATVKDAFLTDSPYNLRVTKPWIVGLNSREGAFKIMSLLADRQIINDTFQGLESTLPVHLMYNNRTDRLDEITKAVLKRYDLTGPNRMDALSSLFSDAFFKWPIVEAMKISSENTWLYLFDYRGKISSTDLTLRDKIDIGVSHTDELLYLFDFEDEVPNMKNPEDHDMSRILCKLWTDFAKNGKPTEDDSWRTRGDDMAYLHLGPYKTNMETHLYKEDMDWWSSLRIRDALEAKGL